MPKVTVDRLSLAFRMYGPAGCSPCEDCNGLAFSMAGNSAVHERNRNHRGRRLRGIANIVLIIRRSVWNFPVAIAMVSLYFVMIPRGEAV